MTETRLEFDVGEEAEGLRIDKCIAEQYEDITRSFINKVIKNGGVLINGKVVKASKEVKLSDHVSIELPEGESLEVLPEDIPLDILYEDSDVLVVNKPKGMVVHPSPGHYSGTLVNALLYHIKDLSGINGVMRPGIVHRIDKDTTGSLIICKNDKAHISLSAQLADHSLNRLYVAIVNGNFKEDEGTVDAPLARSTNDRKKMAVTMGGRRAVTHYKVIERFGNYTCIECKLETGRTHQIRVHMAHIGHPVLGDTVYSKGNSPFHTEGQTLHARTLGFIHPTTGEYVETNAPLPEYFEKILARLRADKT
ncbi:MAG: RluA family pseudouridine synthase [Lachnospiraceae bacterium]|nr:RluA family pseudouridine synthase [Lachnospiraceae bacterium]